MCDARFFDLWAAAQSAVLSLGGKVVWENEPGGMMLGELLSDTLGANIQLHITVGRVPDHDPRARRIIRLTVKASEKGSSASDEHRMSELIDLEKRYLALVGEHVVRLDATSGCSEPMGAVQGPSQ